MLQVHGVKLWIDGIAILEFKKVEAKVSTNREDIQVGIDMDSKLTSLKGEINVTVNKVYSSYNEVMKNYTSGKDVRSQVIAKLKDPDSPNAQMERWSLDNVWWNDIPLFIAEKGALIEEELTGRVHTIGCSELRCN